LTNVGKLLDPTTMEGGIMRTLAFLAAFLAATLAHGQIDVPAETPAHAPIVAALANPIPEGAQVQGGWVLPTGKFLVVANGIHVWAPPGTNQIAYRGVWIKTTPITLPDGTVVQVLQGFGFLDESAVFKVTGGGPNPPLPPTPGGPWQVMLFYQADQLDNYPEAQRQLLTSRVVREQLNAAGHVFRKVVEAAALDQAATDGEFAAWFSAVRGKPLPRLAIAPKDGGRVREFPLPTTLGELWEVLKNADL
jgi:hypothetical protein